MKHPGSGFVYVICDVCGGKFRRKDTQLVRDKYNFQNGLVVCKKDLDRINEQVLPNKIKESVISAPETLQTEKADQFAAQLIDDRLPGAPRLPFTQVNPINDTIDLFWQGPEDNGSSPISGYKIQQTTPQGAPFITLESSTGTNATYYQDLVSNVNLIYAYRVAAINSFGTGAYSEEFYWPTPNREQLASNYIVTSDTMLVITTGSGLYFVIN